MRGSVVKKRTVTETTGGRSHDDAVSRIATQRPVSSNALGDPARLGLRPYHSGELSALYEEDRRLEEGALTRLPSPLSLGPPAIAFSIVEEARVASEVSRGRTSGRRRASDSPSRRPCKLETDPG